MEVNGKASHKNEKKPLENSAPASVPKRLPENNSSTSIFVNHGKFCSFLPAIDLKHFILIVP